MCSKGECKVTLLNRHVGVDYDLRILCIGNGVVGVEICHLLSRV